MKECILEAGQICRECGGCERCDLDEEKICDNCCRCLGDADFRAIEITEIILPEELKTKRKDDSSKN
ncbi:MAG TPA: hypothetical protein PLC07_03920 [Bacillota bacterium]|nr:hypothetical protein [Bacillota bacterium]HPT86554.1 hypothetical protein [Bacillota bacterium]